MIQPHPDLAGECQTSFVPLAEQNCFACTALAGQVWWLTWYLTKYQFLCSLCRPPLQANSEQAKPAATMNTCGAMMCGSNQSKDALNDGELAAIEHANALHTFVMDLLFSQRQPCPTCSNCLYTCLSSNSSKLQELHRSQMHRRARGVQQATTTGREQQWKHVCHC